MLHICFKLVDLLFEVGVGINSNIMRAREKCYVKANSQQAHDEGKDEKGTY